MPTCIKVKIGVMIRCRRCEYHIIPLPRWGFNGDMDRPTFTPSLKETNQHGVCHFVVTAGNIAYQSDCWHDLKGQTLPLEEWSQEDVERYNQAGY
jgi:Family of unknown function (DUF6527)